MTAMPIFHAPKTLAALASGEMGVIQSLAVVPELLPRMAALGFHVGETIQVIRRAPFAGPLHIRIGTTDLIMRRADAHGILVA